MTIQQIAAKAAKLAADNSPLILTSIGVAGVVGTAVLTGRAVLKADEIIRAEESVAGTAEDPKQRFKERAKLTWKLYIPPVLSAGFTIYAIVEANRIGTRRAAIMAAAYTTSVQQFEQYREKIVEKLSPGKEKEVRDEIAQDRLNERPINSSQVIITDAGDSFCFDTFSGRYFKSSMESMKKAINDINFKVLNHEYASLNDFYDKVGLSPIDVGNELGWTTDSLCDVIFSTGLTEDERPCHTITFYSQPVRDYFRVNR